MINWKKSTNELPKEEGYYLVKFYDWLDSYRIIYFDGESFDKDFHYPEMQWISLDVIKQLDLQL